MNFTSINDVEYPMTMKGIVGPVPYEKVEIYSIPIGIDRGHHCPGALVYKTVDGRLVMYSESRNIFLPLMIQQLDDIETTDGRQFCFADDGEYGICNFHIPEGIRKRNIFIKNLGVIQWEESLHYDWFEDDRRSPRVYQWNPRTDYVREVYSNGTFSGWHEYVIENSYRAKLIVDDLFDDKYAGLIEWALAQHDEPEDDYSDISAEWEEAYEAVGRELDEYEPDYSDIIERYDRWDSLRAWAMQQPDEPEDNYADIAERYERWHRMVKWAKENTDSEDYEKHCELHEFLELAKFHENKKIAAELIKNQYDMTFEKFYYTVNDGYWYFDVPCVECIRGEYVVVNEVWSLEKYGPRMYLCNIDRHYSYCYDGHEWCGGCYPSDAIKRFVNVSIKNVVIPSICKRIVEYQIGME